MDEDRSKRLGKILESANEFEARQRRSNVSSALWGVVIVVLLVAMFFAGRAFYSTEPMSGSAKSDDARTHLAADNMTPGPTPATSVTSAAPPGSASASSKPDDNLPEAVRLTSAAELHVKRAGKVVGVIYLKAGETVRPVERDAGKLLVIWGDAEGTVPVSATTLGEPAAE